MLPLEEAGGQSEAMQGGTAIEVQQAVPTRHLWLLGSAGSGR